MLTLASDQELKVVYKLRLEKSSFRNKVRHGQETMEAEQFSGGHNPRIKSKDSKAINSLNSIIDILKKNEFKIDSNVVSEAVLELVLPVEL
jgi:hypothetical protein